jgi:hypothetical protein
MKPVYECEFENETKYNVNIKVTWLFHFSAGNFSYLRRRLAVDKF